MGCQSGSGSVIGLRRWQSGGWHAAAPVPFVSARCQLPATFLGFFLDRCASMVHASLRINGTNRVMRFLGQLEFAGSS